MHISSDFSSIKIAEVKSLTIPLDPGFAIARSLLKRINNARIIVYGIFEGDRECEIESEREHFPDVSISVDHGVRPLSV